MALIVAPGSAAQTIRRPRLRVLVDGVVAGSALDARVVSNNYYSADWFHVSLVAAESGPFSLSYWSSVKRPLIEIQSMVTESTAPKSMILGYADSVGIDTRRKVVRVDGRDLSALMVDSCLHEVFPNYAADAIISVIALRHGLNPKVISTAGLAGRMFGGEQLETGLSQYARASTDWDLVVRLAQRAGHDVYVEGRDFYFQPSGAKKDQVIQISQDDVTDLMLERNLVTSLPEAIFVSSWNSQGQQAFSSGPSGAGVSYQYGIAPNMSAGQIAQTVGQYMAATEAYARSIEITMPGELEITARSRIALQGTGTDFDRSYDIECIDRTFSPLSGFHQRIRARQVSDIPMGLVRSLVT